MKAGAMSQIAAAYIAVFSIVILFLLVDYLRHRGGGRSNGKNKGVRLPPGPPAVPIIGHLHLVKKPMHATLSRLAARHGPVFSLRLGSRRAVVVSSPGCARECFTEHDVAFANRPRFESQLLMSFDGTALAMASYGPHWRNLRRVAAVQLLSARRVGLMSGLIAGEVRAMVRSLCRRQPPPPPRESS
uniref:Cytochrome P450 n=1 Tax=Oryza meridionalis TaxID=40149 RepID=A0A0E0D750_9ORYZ